MCDGDEIDFSLGIAANRIGKVLSSALLNRDIFLIAEFSSNRSLVFTGIGCHYVFGSTGKHLSDFARSSANVVSETPYVAVTAMVIPNHIVES